MSSAPQYLTTKEVADLLRLKERKVYDLAADGGIPCTRATGKLLFSRSAIDQWLLQHSSHQHHNKSTPLISGSHDPLLEWAVRESQCGIATLFDGSEDGLQKFSDQQATVAAVHLYSHKEQTWNVPQVVDQCRRTTGVLVNWLYRQRGLVFKPGLDLKGVTDIKQLAIAARQAGAGSQILLESLLVDAGVDPSSLNYTVVARSESDSVVAVVEGVADCTFGLQSLAVQHKLGFLPLIDEPLDLLIDRHFWFEPSMQQFVGFCLSELFADRVEQLNGYRIEKPFEVLFNG